MQKKNSDRQHTIAMIGPDYRKHFVNRSCYIRFHFEDLHIPKNNIVKVAS